ncbi:hypothetical protein PV703_16115, partial [Streptomyces sp. ME01-24h]|nr:hypothetical protein [Streptomyces sp. ME01-24h]
MSLSSAHQRSAKDQADPGDPREQSPSGDAPEQKAAEGVSEAARAREQAPTDTAPPQEPAPTGGGPE